MPLLPPSNTLVNLPSATPGRAGPGAPATAIAGSAAPLGQPNSRAPGAVLISAQTFVEALSQQLQTVQMPDPPGAATPAVPAAVQALPLSGRRLPPGLELGSDETSPATAPDAAALAAAGLPPITVPDPGLPTAPAGVETIDAKAAPPADAALANVAASAALDARQRLQASAAPQRSSTAPEMPPHADSARDASPPQTFGARLVAAALTVTSTAAAATVATAASAPEQAAAASLPEATPPAATAPPHTLAPAPEPARAALPQLHIERPVGTAGWADSVGQQITWMAENQVGRAELRLHPQHLGPLEVQVTVTQDEVSVVFQATHPATREALESSLPRLRELLSDSGLTLSQASVSQQSAGQQQQRMPERAPVHADARPLARDEPLGREGLDTPRARVGLLDAYA